MDLGLKGKIALVTGASRGIGRAVAERLAEEGSDLVLVARRAEGLEGARAELAERFGVNVRARPVDLSDPSAQDALVKAIPDIDILVNNAAVIIGGNLEELPESRWWDSWSVKTFGYIRLTRRYLPLLRARGGGVIVNVIGTAGERPNAKGIIGSAGNAALMSFTRAIGAESPASGIRVVGVNPGPVNSEWVIERARAQALDQFGDAERWRELQAGYPFGRAADPGEIADVVAFAASPRAAYVSGTIITVDGGLASRPSL